MSEDSNSPKWHRVKSEDDIEYLLKTFGGFHDSCLREIYIWTEQSVNEGMSMSCLSYLDVRMRALFQRQWKNPSAIELLFEQVIGMNLISAPENYSAEILDAWLTQTDDIFRWSDSPAGVDEESTWFEAKVLWWREASEWMGPELRYGKISSLPRVNTEEYPSSSD